MKWKNRIQNWAEKNKYDIVGWCICAVLVGLSTYGIYTMFQGIQNENPVTEIEMENLNPETKDDIEITLEPAPTTTSKIESTPEPKETPLPGFTEASIAYYPLTDEDRYLVECMVTGEAGNQPYEGKVAVANCIVNACLEGYYTPAMVKEMYSYGFYDIEKFELECLAAYGNTNLSDEVRQAVSQVFDDGKILSDNIFWFYNPSYCYSSFHENMRYQFTIGPHKFFGKW